MTSCSLRWLDKLAFRRHGVASRRGLLNVLYVVFTDFTPDTPVLEFSLHSYTESRIVIIVSFVGDWCRLSFHTQDARSTAGLFWRRRARSILSSSPDPFPPSSTLCAATSPSGSWVCCPRILSLRATYT